MTWFLLWLFAVEAAGLAALPVAAWIFRPLPDRGFFLAKPLGILLIGYLCWLPTVLGLVRFQRGTLLAVTVVLAAVSWAMWGRNALKLLRSARAALVVSELIFLSALVAGAVLRASVPDISGTEKPMDFAFLNAVSRTETLPPEDPWLSGYGISYYYFGYYLLGALTKLSGIPASVGYNLSVALVFAMLIAGSYSVAFNLLSTIRPSMPLLGRLAGALLAPVIVGVMGNLEIAFEVMANQGVTSPWPWQWAGIKNLRPSPTPYGLFPDDFWWWWRASRVIPTTTPDGINEFPFFSFLLGDLHPHFSGLPWVLVAIAVSMSVIIRRTVGSRDAGGWPDQVLAGIVLGFPLVGNSWDYPTYVGLYAISAIVPLGRQEWTKDYLLAGVRAVLPVIALSVALFLPFFLGFASQTRGIGLSADRTPLASMLIIFGWAVAALIVFLGWRGGSKSANGGQVYPRRKMLVIAGAILIAVSPIGGSLALLAGLALLGLAAVHRYYEETISPSTCHAGYLFLLTLMATGLALILVPEFVFLLDLFGTRMNTVFKFHYQAWVLLGLGCAVGVAWVLGSVRPRIVALAALLPFALLVGVGLMYPLSATASRMKDSSAQATLDGAAFLQSQHPDEYSAIQWLATNASGRPVVMEATGGSYTSFARVATFSGLPTVLGWAGHEAQWGRSGAELQRRSQDIDAVYSTANRESVLPLLRKYQVTYLFIGSLEVEKYGAGVADRFSGLLEPAYRKGSVVIYRVPSGGSGS